MKHSIHKSLISLILVVSMLFSFSAYFSASQLARYGTVKENGVRVRTTPTTTVDTNKLTVNGKVVNLNSGEVVKVLDTVDSLGDSTYKTWLHIEFTYENTVYKGYVYSGFVQVNNFDENVILPNEVPEIYKPYVQQLLANHPNWKFVFVDVNCDWNYLFTEDAEGAFGRNVVQYTFPLSYRSTDPLSYDWRNDKWINPGDEAGWYQANNQVIAYYMDPRNFLNEEKVFVFEALSYDQNSHTLDGINSILKNSFMDNVTILNLANQPVSYAMTYLYAGTVTNVSPFHLASRTLQEVGYSVSGSVTGNYVAKNGTSYKGYYNFYNINAHAGEDPISYGLLYASGKDKDGKLLPQTTIDKYMLPWNSQLRAIVGGAKWIAEGYINKKQDTLYYQKFNVVNKVWYHQYMANIMAPESEATRTRNKYATIGVLDNSFTFIVPYFRNMPAQPCQLPIWTNANPNNYLSSLTIGNYNFGFNPEVTSGYSINVPASVSSVNVAATTVNSKATVSGVGNISLNEGNNTLNVVVTAENGIKRTYTINVNRAQGERVPLTGISLNKTSLSMFANDTATLTVNYNPAHTTDDKTVVWTSSNPAVATVSNGKITTIAKGETTITAQVGQFKATCQVKVTTDVMLGDIDADSSITIADALMIFKYKTGEVALSSVAQLAADTDKNGKTELADALRIFKYKSGEIDAL